MAETETPEQTEFVLQRLMIEQWRSILERVAEIDKDEGGNATEEEIENYADKILAGDIDVAFLADDELRELFEEYSDLQEQRRAILAA
jgi:hypothetical protein